MFPLGCGRDSRTPPLLPSWQSAQRELVGLEPIGMVDGVKAAGWAIAVVAVVLFLSRLGWSIVAAPDGWAGADTTRLELHLKTLTLAGG